jgi:hypothetical protein
MGNEIVQGAVAPESAPAPEPSFGSFSEVLDSTIVEQQVLGDPDMITTGLQAAPQGDPASLNEKALEPAAQEPMYKLKHNGQEFNVTLSEMQELAQKGKDYTHKTQSLADERRRFGEQVQQFESINSGLNAPENRDLLDAISARMRGERAPAYPQYAPQALPPNGNQSTDTLEALRLDPEVYEPHLVATVDALIEETKNLKGGIKQYETQEMHKAMIGAGQAYESEFKSEFGRDMSQPEVDAIIGFMHKQGLNMTSVDNFRMAGNYLFENDRIASRVQKEIEKLKADHNNGVISRTPTSGVRPVANGHGEVPNFKSHDEASRYINKAFGL